MNNSNSNTNLNLPASDIEFIDDEYESHQLGDTAFGPTYIANVENDLIARFGTMEEIAANDDFTDIDELITQCTEWNEQEVEGHVSDTPPDYPPPMIPIADVVATPDSPTEVEILDMYVTPIKIHKVTPPPGFSSIPNRTYEPIDFDIMMDTCVLDKSKIESLVIIPVSYIDETVLEKSQLMWARNADYGMWMAVDTDERIVYAILDRAFTSTLREDDEVWWKTKDGIAFGVQHDSIFLGHLMKHFKYIDEFTTAYISMNDEVIPLTTVNRRHDYDGRNVNVNLMDQPFFELACPTSPDQSPKDKENVFRYAQVSISNIVYEATSPNSVTPNHLAKEADTSRMTSDMIEAMWAQDIHQYDPDTPVAHYMVTNYDRGEQVTLARKLKIEDGEWFFYTDDQAESGPMRRLCGIVSYDRSYHAEYYLIEVPVRLIDGTLSMIAGIVEFANTSTKPGFHLINPLPGPFYCVNNLYEPGWANCLQAVIDYMKYYNVCPYGMDKMYPLNLNCPEIVDQEVVNPVEELVPKLEQEMIVRALYTVHNQDARDRLPIEPYQEGVDYSVRRTSFGTRTDQHLEDIVSQIDQAFNRREEIGRQVWTNPNQWIVDLSIYLPSGKTLFDLCKLMNISPSLIERSCHEMKVPLDLVLVLLYVMTHRSEIEKKTKRKVVFPHHAYCSLEFLEDNDVVSISGNPLLVAISILNSLSTKYLPETIFRNVPPFYMYVWSLSKKQKAELLSYIEENSEWIGIKLLHSTRKDRSDVIAIQGNHAFNEHMRYTSQEYQEYGVNRDEWTLIPVTYFWCLVRAFYISQGCKKCSHPHRLCCKIFWSGYKLKKLSNWLKHGKKMAQERYDKLIPVGTTATTFYNYPNMYGCIMSDNDMSQIDVVEDRKLTAPKREIETYEFENQSPLFKTLIQKVIVKEMDEEGNVKINVVNNVIIKEIDNTTSETDA